MRDFFRGFHTSKKRFKRVHKFGQYRFARWAQGRGASSQIAYLRGLDSRNKSFMK